MKLDDPSTWPTPQQAVTSVHERYGAVTVTAWGHQHPQLHRRAGWATHCGPLPLVQGSLILVRVERLPGDQAPKPVWLWHSHPQVADLDVLRLFHAFLRRFDLEHTFRFLKQTLGWTRPRLRRPDQADQWTWLILAAYTQLRLARHLAEDLRRPWEKPLQPAHLTPGRVRRGFPRVQPTTAHPAAAPKPSRPPERHPEQQPSTPLPRRETVHNRHTEAQEEDKITLSYKFRALLDATHRTSRDAHATLEPGPDQVPELLT